MQLLVLVPWNWPRRCGGTGLDGILLSEAARVCEAEDSSLGPGVPRDRGGIGWRCVFGFGCVYVCLGERVGEV